MILLMLLMGNKICLYPPTTLGQGLMALKWGALKVLRHTGVDTGEVQTVPDLIEEVSMTIEEDMVREEEEGLMVLDFMVHHIDSTPPGDEEGS